MTDDYVMDNTLEKISKAGIKFLEPLDPNSTYTTIVKEAAGLVDAHSAALFLANSNFLERVASFPSDPTNPVTPRLRGYTYKAFKSRKTHFVNIEKVEKGHPEFKGKNFGSAIYIPITDHKNTLGTLAVLSYERNKFTKKEMRALEIFSSYATLAIRNAQLFEEAHRAIETRDLFISMAAHELRTPLTSIHGYIQLLHSKLVNGENTPESRWIGQLLFESTRLTNLVSELLEVNRIKAGSFHYNLLECSLEDVLTRVVDIFKIAYPERVLDCKAELVNNNRVVIGDFDKLLQVVTNLLDNAVKFSAQDTPITLGLSENRTSYIITIQDRGIGIEKSDIPKLFEGYYRGRGHDREGMGLGLFLAREIINRHHGSIKIKSKLKKGTIIEIKLPKLKI